jgi:hypothetical protein
MLLAKGVDVKICGGWSETPLQAAVNVEMLKWSKLFLMQARRSMWRGGSLGSPLQAAASRGAVDISSLLIARGADVNEESGEYGCALNAAVA